nr:MAG TPA: leucine-rich repeat protein [Caudoviricetes sp.]
MADLGTATIQCTLGAGYIDTAEAERLESEIAGKDAEIAALEAKIVELNEKVETAKADVLADFKSVIDRSVVNLELPEGLTKIGIKAFGNCVNLTSIDLPEGVTVISNFAFENCLKLKTVKLPASLTEIQQEVFASCYPLALSELPAGLTKIGYRAFYRCSSIGSKLTELPAELISIGGSAFESCGLKVITFKGTPTTITNSAFSNNGNLTVINVPWAEGEVSGAPWGATNATINYNYTGGEA